MDPGREASIGRVLTRNSAFKIQLKAMYIDASLNSVSTILGNLYQSFHEAAVRCLEYVRVLSRVRTTCSSLLISTSILFPRRQMVAQSDAHAKWTSQEPIPKSRPDKAGARLLHGRSAAKTSGNQVYELTSVLNNYRNG